LLDIVLGGTGTDGDGREYVRSLSCGDCPMAVIDDNEQGGSGSGSLAKAVGLYYLIVKYAGNGPDAQNIGYVWNISGITDSIELPGEDSFGNGPNRYVAFNIGDVGCNGSCVPVPEPGTIGLLGLGLLGMGLTRRRRKV